MWLRNMTVSKTPEPSECRRSQLTITSCSPLDSDGLQLDVVFISCLHEQPRLIGGSYGRLGVHHGLWVHHDPVGLAAQAVQRLEDHDRVAQVGQVRDVLRVRKARPVDSAIIVGRDRGYRAVRRRISHGHRAIAQAAQRR
jgi:hypothetical protein